MTVGTSMPSEYGSSAFQNINFGPRVYMFESHWEWVQLLYVSHLLCRRWFYSGVLYLFVGRPGIFLDIKQLEIPIT